MIIATIEVFKGAGLLIYPLGLCSAVAVFIICERAYALRQGAVMPHDLVNAIVSGKPLVGGHHSVLARIVDFAGSTLCSRASWTLPRSTSGTRMR